MKRQFAIAAPDARLVWLLPGVSAIAAMLAIVHAATTQREPMLWLWLVLWGAAFVLKDDEEIRIDLIAERAGARTRRVIGAIGAVSLLVLFGMSLPASWAYVTFMRVEKSSYLGIRMDFMYSIYLVFAMAVIARCLRQLVRGPAPSAGDAPPPPSAL